MEGEVKIKVEHVVINQNGGNGGSGARAAKPKALLKVENLAQIQSTKSTSSMIDNFLNSHTAKFATGLTAILASNAKSIGEIFLNDYSTWSGDVGRDITLQKFNFIMKLGSNLVNPIEIAKMFYKYNAQIASINSQADLIANRSGNSALTNGSRGTRE